MLLAGRLGMTAQRPGLVMVLAASATVGVATSSTAVRVTTAEALATAKPMAATEILRCVSTTEKAVSTSEVGMRVPNTGEVVVRVPTSKQV